jgi:large-conductance mechanosensitive channel
MYGYGSIWGTLLNIILIVAIVWIAVTYLGRSNLSGSGDNERLARVEKDVEDIKKMVETIKDKLDEI